MKRPVGSFIGVVIAMSCGVISGFAEPAADADTKLMQFTAGGHVLGFQEDRLYMATGSHALRISFGGTAGVRQFQTAGPPTRIKPCP